MFRKCQSDMTYVYKVSELHDMFIESQGDVLKVRKCIEHCDIDCKV